MYKVFFNDRSVYFGDDFSKIFEKNSGLFYHYNNVLELKELVYAFNDLRKIDKLFIFHEDILSLFEDFKSCFNYIEAGGGLVLNDVGQFLIMKRNGIWDLPKGKLEVGESFETAGVREVIEETGLSPLKIIKPVLSTFHTYQLKESIVLKKTKWFEMLYTGKGEPIPEEAENITEIRWVDSGKTDFIRKNTYPSVLDVLYIRDLL